MNNKDLRQIILSGVILTVVLSVLSIFFSFWCGVICFTLGTVLTVIFYVYTQNRYKRLNELNNYLSLVCSGNYDLNIDNNTEGELSILQNNLYKVISILRSQNELLEKDKCYLAQSLADISHQLKTPLTSMMVMTDLLKEEKSEVKQAEFISVLEGQLDKMRWLITNLLKISKLDAGTVVLKKQINSSVDIVNSVVASFILMLELKQIQYENTVVDFTFNVDKEWTVEALGNVFKNCIEHTSQGGKISVSSEQTNIYDLIRIKDNGCGISKEDLPHIFERFYHGKNSSSESVGIGLALSKSILEKENAQISVKSSEGNGTEFEIKFYKGII